MRPTIRPISDSIDGQLEVRMSSGISRSHVNPNSKEKRRPTDQTSKAGPSNPAENTERGQRPTRHGALRDVGAINALAEARMQLHQGRCVIFDEAVRQIDTTTTVEHTTMLLKLGADPNAIPGASEGTRGSRPALYQAIHHGNIPCLRALLRYGADPNGIFGDKAPLEAAVQAGNIETVNLLLNEGASRDNVKSVNKAISKENRDMVQLLLQRGLRADQTSLKVAVSKSQSDIVEMLLEHGIVPDPSALDEAVSRGFYGILQKLLRNVLRFGRLLFEPLTHIPQLLLKALGKLAKAKSLRTVQTAKSMFKLMFRKLFAKVGSLQEMRRLITSSGLLQHAISVQGKRQDNAVGRALCQARQEMCSLVLDQGIDVNGESGCFVDRRHPHSPLTCALKHQVVIREDTSCILEIVELLVIQHHAAVNAPDPLQAPLLLAASGGYQSSTDLLLTGGANYDPRQVPEHHRVLEAAINQNWTATTVTLLQKCPNLRRSYLRDNSAALLCAAVEQKNEPMAQSLLTAGFKVQRSSIRRAVECDMTTTVSQMLIVIADDDVARRHFMDRASSILRQAIRNRNPEIARMLLREGIRGGIATFTETVEQGMTETLQALAANRVRIHRGEDEDALRGCFERCTRMAVDAKNTQMVDCLWRLQREHGFPQTAKLLQDTIRYGNAEMVEFFLGDEVKYYSFTMSLLDATRDKETMRVLWRTAAKCRIQRHDLSQETALRIPTLLQRVVSTADAELVQFMFQAADRRGHADLWGFLSLQIAHRGTDTPEEVKTQLMNHPSNQTGAMLFAAERYDWTMVRKLVKEGAEINHGIANIPLTLSTSRLSGFPPIFHAIYAQDKKAVRGMIRGVNLRDIFNAGRSIEFNTLKGLKSECWTPLHLAVVLFIELALQGPHYGSQDEFEGNCKQRLRIIEDLVDYGADPKLELPMRLVSRATLREQHLSAVHLATKFFSKSWWSKSRVPRSQLLQALRPI